MDSARDLAEWTDLARRELVDLVAITSFSDEEHLAVDHLVARCAELGLPAHRQPVEGSADNLLVGWSERPELLLTAHVDTIRRRGIGTAPSRFGATGSSGSGRRTTRGASWRRYSRC